MSLDKAIQSGKEHRKEYKGSKAIDRTCRNHGSCPFCIGNRTYQSSRAKDSAQNQMDEYYKEEENHEKR